MSAPNSVIVPVVTVQPTASEIIEEVNDGVVPTDKFWVSCYKTSEPSIHTKIHVELDEQDRNLVKLNPEDRSLDFELLGGGRNGYRVSASALGISNVQVLTPSQEYTDEEKANPPNPKRIDAFDISPDGSRFATGFLDGSVLIYPTSFTSSTSTYSPRKLTATANSSKVYSRPHLSGVTTVRFFPSSRVLLTTGLDFSLSILPADLPERNSTTSKPSSITVQPARTLRGHTRSVTATAIVGVGRNIVSASLDSTIRLWDVPSGSTISTISSSSAVLSISMGERFGNAGAQAHADEREVPEVQSNIVFAGLRDGTFEAFDLGSKKAFFHSKAPTQSQQLTSIVYSPQIKLLATGSSKGLVTIYDVRSSLDTPLSSFVRQEGGEVLDLAAFPSTVGDSVSLGLAVATSDGLPYVATIGPDGSIRADELVGVDCDPVRQVRVRQFGEGGQVGQEVWTASDDSVVRRYVY